MTRTKTILLLIHIGIGVTAAIVTGWFLYQKKIGYWRTHAQNTFHTALVHALEQKNIMTYNFVSGNNKDLSSIISNDADKKPIKVTVLSEYGKKNFIIPYEKHIHNVIRDSDIRAIHSYMLAKMPFSADSLNLSWVDLLSKSNYPGETVVRVSVSDWNERDTDSFSSDSMYVSKSDSIISYYLGYRCEARLTGYIYCPWWVSLSFTDMLLLCSLFIFCVLLFFIDEHLYDLYCNHFIKIKEVYVVEKEVIPVIAVDKNESHIYQLEENLFFDISLKTLRNGNKFVKLTPMSAKLLKGFLGSENYRLSNNEIMNLLWPEGTGTPTKLHTNIKRLRDYLSECTDWTIENDNFSYILNRSHFIA